MNRRQTKKYVNKMSDGNTDATKFIQSLYDGKVYRIGKNKIIGGIRNGNLFLPNGTFNLRTTNK